MFNKFFGLFEGKKIIWALMFCLPLMAHGQDKANISYQAKSVTTSDYRNVSGFEQMGVIVREELKSYNIRLRSDDVYEVTIQKQNPSGADGEVVMTKFEGTKMYLYDANGQLVFEDDFSSELSGSTGLNMDILQLDQSAVLSYLESASPNSSFNASKGGGNVGELVNIDASPDRQLAFDVGSGLLVAESTYANGQVVSDIFYKSSRNGGKFVLEGIDQTLYLGANQPKTHITTEVTGYQAQFIQSAISNLSKN
jgi:hypothetical protein